MRNNIRYRLKATFIVLSTMPLFLVGLILAWQSFSIQQQQALSLQHEVARTVSFQITMFMQSLDSDLSQLSQVEGVQPSNISRQAYLLTQLLTQQTAFDELVLLDGQGHERVRLNRSQFVTPDDLIDRSNRVEFLQPYNSGRTYYSPLAFDEEGEPLMTVAQPLLNPFNNRAHGVLVGRIRLSKIWGLLQNIQAGESGEIYMVDGHGRVIAHQLSSVVSSETYVELPLRPGLRSGLSGTPVVLAMEPLHFGSQVFYVVAERPVFQAFALAINALLITVVVVGAVLLAASGLGVMIAHQIVQPIEMLVATARAIAAGDLSQRVRIDRPDEIGLLADSFNQMTDQLQQTLESQARFVAILEETPDFVAMMSSTGHTLYINRAGRAMVGLDVNEPVEQYHLSELYSPELASTMQEEKVAIARSRGIWRGQSLFLSRNGTEVPVSQIILSHKGPGGQVAFFSTIARDITERKRNEEALARRTAELEEAHNFLDSLIENLPAMLFMKEAKTLRFIRWNKAAEELIGVERSKALHKSDYDFFPPEQADAFTRSDQEVLQGRRLMEISEEPITTANGEIRFLHSRKVPLLDAEGEPQYLLGLSIDITERKRAETALRQSEQRLELALAGADLALWDWNIQTDELVVNRRWAEMLGYTLAEVAPQGRSWDERLHPSDIPRVEAMLEAYLNGISLAYEAEYRLQTQSGEWIWVLDRGKVVERDPEGRPLRMVGTHLDVTARKRAEEALRETSETLETLIQASPLAIDMIDLEGRVALWNPAAERLFGWSEAEVLGQPLPIIPEDQREKFQSWLREGYNGASRMATEVVRLRKDGSLVEVNLWTAPLTDAQGKTVAVMGILSDITERKQLEVQLRQAQKMEAVGRLAGGVAHDFNNILTVITGYTELLLDECSGGGTSHCQDIKQIRLAAERAASLTRQLLAFSRQQMLQPEVLNLNLVINNLGKMLSRLIGEDIELVTILQPGLGQVKADPGQIEQVIMNLAVNGRDAMPQGGKLIIETANVELDESYTRKHIGVTPGQYILLILKDTGQGMDPETCAHIFEPFFTTKENGKGTGLGLATVHGIVNQSGGHIWVESQPGRGSTFKIYLPRVDPPPLLTEPEQYLLKVRPGSETILLVEDEDRVRELAYRVLSRHGYKVLEADQGVRAVELFENYPDSIHLLVTDVIMPGGMSGRVLAEQLLALQPQLKVLYMSGYTDNATIQDVLESGSAFLQKPFTPDILAYKVREILDMFA